MWPFSCGARYHSDRAGEGRAEVSFVGRRRSPRREPEEMAPSTPGLAEEQVAPDEAAIIAEFIAFLKEASLRRHPTGPIRRFNQGRHSACVAAEFSVRDGLAAEHRVGLFAEPRTYSAFIRFANA